ncbi:MAG: hypothetical protein AAFN78_12365 [Pseudomonadota bacterium]
MKTTIALSALALLFSATAVHGQDDDVRVVQLPVDWSVGTRYNLTVEKGRRETQGDTVLRDMTSTTDVAAEVVEATDAGFIIRWTFNAVHLPETQPSDPIVDGITRLTEGMQLDLIADTHGTVHGLANTAEVREVLAEAVAMLRAGVVESGVDEQMVAGALDPMVNAMLGEGMEGLVIKDAVLFSFPSGGTFVVGREQAYEDLLPFPLTGEMIPTNAAFLLESVDDDAGTAVLTWRQTLDPEKTAEAVKTFLENMANKLGKEAAAELEGFTVDIRDEARFVYDLQTGLPRLVEHSRAMSTGPRSRVDSLRFEVLPPR